MADVFISYSRKDQDFVRKLHDELVATGRSVWVDWENIPLTADWLEEVKDGIEDADAFISVISPDAVRSEIVAAEIDHAIKNSKRFVPILHRELIEDHDKAALHPRISSHNWTFMRDDDDFDTAFKKLVEALEIDLDYTRFHTRLLTRALEWDGKSRDTSFVLRGNDLSEAEGWYKEATKSDVEKEPAITELQTAYIKASQEAEKWQKRERLLMTTITVAFFAALIAAGVAIVQSVRAEEQRVLAEEQSKIARRLSSAANSQVALTNNDSDLAIALALEANEGQQRSETERALADAAYSAGTVLQFTEHIETKVQVVAFSPDGQFAVSGADDGSLWLWEPLTGQAVLEFEGHEDVVKAVIFSPDGNQILSGGCGERNDEDSCTRGDMILWDAETGEEIRRFEGHEATVNSLEFDRDGERILSGADDQTMRLWDVATGEQLQVFAENQGAVVDVSFHPVDNTGLAMAIDTSPILWDLESGEIIQEYSDHFISEPNLAVGSAVFSHDGTMVLGSFGIDIHLWNIETGDLITALQGHGSYVNSVAFSPNEEFVVSSAWREQSIRVWDVEHGVELRRFEGHDGVVRSVAINADNRYALSASDDSTVRVWDLEHGAEVRSYAGHTADIFAVDIHPDGNTFISSGDDDVIRMWDFETGEQIQQLAGHNADIWSVDISPDGSQIVSGGEDSSMRLWDVETGEELQVFADHANWVTVVSFHPDGQQAASGSNDQLIRIWDTQAGELLNAFGEGGGQLRSLAFSPDGQFLLAGATDARLFNLDTLEVELTLTEHTDRINSVAFSHDGSMLATGSADGTIRVWDATTGETLRQFVGHSGQVRSVAFDANDANLLSSSADATLRLWNIDSGLEVRIFEGHEVWVNQAVFTPDGKFAISGSWDDTLKLWHIHQVDELVEWTKANRYVRDLTCNEQNIYLVTHAKCEG